MQEEDLDKSPEEIEAGLKVIPLSTKSRAVEKANIESVTKELQELLRDKITNYSANGSGWKIVRFVNLTINSFETKPARGASYIPTPEKYKNPKFSLTNIKNEDQ